MFRVKALLVAVVFCWQISCSPAERIELGGANSNISNVSPSNAPTPDARVRKELNAIESNLIYSQILSRIYYESFNQEFELDRFTVSYWLCYRKKTVSPKYVEKITGVAGISDQMVQELKRVNEQGESLRDDLGEKLVAKAVSSDDDLNVLYLTAKKKYPKTKVALDFSKIALSQDGTQALVFVEYYSESRKLVGFYLLVPLVRQSEAPRFSISDENTRAILVFDSRRPGQ